MHRIRAACHVSRGRVRNFPSTCEVAQRRQEEEGCIYEAPCKDCECVYFREMSRTLEKRVSKHNTVKNMTTRMELQSTPGQTNTRWTVRQLRQEKWKGPTGGDKCWRPCTSTDDSKHPTWTVGWPSTPPGYLYRTNPHPLNYYSYLIPHFPPPLQP